MIAQLTGTITGIRKDMIILDVGGVGYGVHTTSYILGKSSRRETATFHIHTHVREEALALYGFLNESELVMFELLIGVSGIGPKAALAILSMADPTAIQTAILNDDASILMRVSGIGKKTAGRVVLELKNKIADIGFEAKAKASIDSDAIEALLAMGYNISDARDALKGIPMEITDVGERVRLALKGLGKK
jgi:Holliday junction DNA helicase RuvA